MKKKHQTYLWVIGTTFVLLLVAQSGFAQTPDWYNELNDFQENISYQWRNRAFSIGVAIFAALAALDISILGIGLIFSDKNVDPFNTILRRIIFIAFLFGILSLFWVLDSVVIGFQEIAFEIFGDDFNINEFKILNAGLVFFDYAEGVLDDNYGFLNYISFSAWVDWIALLFVLFGFVILAIQYAYISMKVLISLTFSPLFLSLLPFKLTRPGGEAYITYIFRIAIQVFLFYMIFFFFWSVLFQIIENVKASGEAGWTTLLSIGFFTYLSITVLVKIPHEISKAVTSGQNIDLGKFLNRIEDV